MTFSYKASTRTEITGHIVAHLVTSCSAIKEDAVPPSDIDLFVTLRKLDLNGAEVYYTGTMGDPVPIVKGWQRVSLRRTDPNHPDHKSYLPYRNYHSTERELVEPHKQIALDVEVWPTSCVLGEGETLLLEIAGHDTQGVGRFSHEHIEDRSKEVFEGLNHIWCGGKSWVTLPIIPN